MKTFQNIITDKDIVQVVGVFIVSFGILIIPLLFLRENPPLLSFVMGLGLFTIVYLILRIFLSKKKMTMSDFSLTQPTFGMLFKYIFLGLLVLVVGGALSSFFSNLLGLENQTAQTLNMTLSDTRWFNIIHLKIVVALLIPFAEEVLFRGFLFRYIRQQKSFLFSALLSSALFSLVHFSLAILPFTFLLGFATAYAYEKSGNLWASILVHIAVNATSVNLFLLTIYS